MTDTSGVRGAATAAALAVVLAAAPAGATQSLLDRSPNVSGNWATRPGTVQFNFLHRFTASDAPVRKVSNFPTFLLGTGVVDGVMVGAHYATNSTLAPAFPNEWEVFGRVAVLDQNRGAPLDLGGQVGYNFAAEGLDGEISVARRFGPLRLIGLSRLLADPYTAGEAQLAVGGGGTLRLTRFVALAGDYVSLTDPDEARGEQAAWSAGVHVAIPNTPHTLSLQVSNTNTATLQGASRGSDRRRYGFEFTVPVTLARFFGQRGAPAPGRATPSADVPAAGEVLRTVIKNMAFQQDRLEIAVGTTVEWTNDDPLSHTVTAVDGRFDSGLIAAGGTWRYTFTEVGTFDFFCTPHPFMTGVIIVKEAP